MAHFAKIENNIVTQVIVVNNDDITDENGNESEAIGIQFCKQLFGEDTVWVQTSYNNNFRKNYAGIDSTYDSTRDAFIPPQPFPSWTLVEETCLWESPVPYPEDGQDYRWNEELLNWKLYQ